MRHRMHWLIAASAACVAASATNGDFDYVTAAIVDDSDGLLTYRVFVVFDDPNDQLISIGSGSSGQQLRFESAAPIHNDGRSFSGLQAEDTAGAPIAGPRDTWVTIGHEGFAGNDTEFTPGFADGDGVTSVIRGSRWCEDNGGWYDGDPTSPVTGTEVLIGQFTFPGSSYVYFRLEGAVYWQPAPGMLQESNLNFASSDPTEFCPADVDRDRAIGFTDLVIVLSEWGMGGCRQADVDEDGIVGLPDLMEVLASWSKYCNPHDP